MKNGEGAMRWLIRKNIKAEFILLKLKMKYVKGSVRIKMKNKKIYYLLIFIFIIIGIVLYGQMKKYKAVKEEQSRQERIKKHMPEVAPLIRRAQKVMQGEIIIEDETDYLKSYNFNPDVYKGVEELDAEITIMDIVIKENEGYIDVRYLITRKNQDGKDISWGGDDERWSIVKNGYEWEIIDCQAMDFYQ